MQCVEIITGPVTPVEPTQSVNSLDTVPAIQQHMCTHILVLKQAGSSCYMSTVMLELVDWWTVVTYTKMAIDTALVGLLQVYVVKVKAN